MKDYPSILGPSGAPQLPCIAFYKYDGSNLRFEWQQKAGWCKYGTRRRLFDHTDPEYGAAVEIFHKKYAAGIEDVIKNDKQFRGVREVICFCEYFGPHSFGGQHDPKHPALAMKGVVDNSPMDLMLFDVNLHKKGMMAPRDFVNTFKHLPIAQVVYEGNLNASFIQDVKDGKYPVVEGVVCKGCVGKAPHGIWMRKIKTRAYIEELKVRFAKDWELYV